MRKKYTLFTLEQQAAFGNFQKNPASAERFSSSSRIRSVKRSDLPREEAAASRQAEGPQIPRDRQDAVCPSGATSAISPSGTAKTGFSEPPPLQASGPCLRPPPRPRRLRVSPLRRQRGSRSPAPIEEIIPRTPQSALDPRHRRHGRKILPSLKALPIPGAQAGLFRHLLLRHADPESQRRHISSEMRTQNAGGRFLGRHARHRRQKKKMRTRGFTPPAMPVYLDQL